ncbi:helix-turn-helix domain-containing protein [Paenibacillus montanisoli]|uniref:HTH araC/xylS-type domain-containing protein n=1 Tax=Paenibacillus montanisoli TaxID=2081970 RepID=A0A328U6E2_9BACL|nr:AraC family transcriptional regulator [Paenibacillus montanisoli]RAP76515.1 hypothetical protein DL346_14125 [Paenibacillus montanisoli]
MAVPFHYHSVHSLVSVADCHFREAESGWSYQLHEHNGYELLHCFSGQLSEWINGESVVMSAGDWLLIGPGVRHSTINESNEGFVYFTIHFGIEDAELTHALKNMNYVHLSQRNERLQGWFTELLGRIEHEAGRSGFELGKSMPADSVKTAIIDHFSALAKQSIQLIAQQLVLHALERATAEEGERQQASRKRLKASEVELAHRIQQRLHDAVTTTDEIGAIARQLFISRSHCNEVFRKVYGIAPKRYLGLMKQSKAEELLLHTGMSAEAIGILLGFSSLSAFSRQFKRWTAQSPQQFRLSPDRERG